MSKKTDALKKMLVALNHGSDVSEYTSDTTAGVLKELAVKLECATSTAEIRVTGVADVMDYITENYGQEEHEPFDLVITKTHASVTVKRNGKSISAGADKLYNGDKLTITAEATEGYEITTLTVNGTAIESGDVFTVNGHNVTIVATGTLQTFDLERTATDCTIVVTKNSAPVSDGENVLSYGDEITITATAGDDKTMSSLTVNGEDFVSGETLTVKADVSIVGVAETEA